MANGSSGVSKVVATLIVAAVLGVTTFLLTGVIGNTNSISVIVNDVGYLKKHVEYSNSKLDIIILKLNARTGD